MAPRTKSPTVESELLNKIKTLEESMFVEIKNGELKRKHIGIVVVETHEAVKTLKRDVGEIKEIVQILADFSRVHRVFKKYKIYWAILLGILLYFGLDMKTILTKMIL